MLILISVFFIGLLSALELDTTPAASIAYDIETGTISVNDRSGVLIASGTEFGDVYDQLH